MKKPEIKPSLKEIVKNDINYENLIFELKEITEGKIKGERTSVVKLRLKAIKILLDFCQE